MGSVRRGWAPARSVRGDRVGQVGTVEAQWVIFAFMALFGMSNGFSFTLFGALWPEIYGVRHLGAVRAVIVAIMVFSSAMGPGLCGLLIDWGVSFPAQIVAMGVYCGAISAVMMQVSRRLKARTADLPAAA